MKAARLSLPLLLSLTFAFTLTAEPEWVKRSNDITATLMATQAKLQPEGASFIGVDGYDAEISQLPLDANARSVAALQEVRAKIAAKRTGEKDPAVLQDIDILLAAIDENIEGTRLSEKYELPYFDFSRRVSRPRACCTRSTA